MVNSLAISSLLVYIFFLKTNALNRVVYDDGGAIINIYADMILIYADCWGTLHHLFTIPFFENDVSDYPRCCSSIQSVWNMCVWASGLSVYVGYILHFLILFSPLFTLNKYNYGKIWLVTLTTTITCRTHVVLLYLFQWKNFLNTF